MGSSPERERRGVFGSSNISTVTVVLVVPTGPVGGAYGGTGVEVGVVGVGGFAAGVLRRCPAIHVNRCFL